MSARSWPTPLRELSTPLPTVNVFPLCRVAMPVRFHPPRTVFANLLVNRTGSSQRPDAVNTCV